jgi:hypothetical protein
MKQFTRLYRSGVFGIIALLAIFLTSSCQYDYSSPQPGIVQVRLKTISENIPFTELNNFIIEFSLIEAVRNDGSRASIYEDRSAIDTKPLGINVLDFRARDSILIVGESYLPPGEYSGIKFTIKPNRFLTLNGYQIISVIPVGFSSSSALIYLPKPFKVDEYRLTAATIEFDLDQTLSKGAFDYLFVPHYKISSIKNY